MHSKHHLSFPRRTISKLPAAIASLILCSAASAQTNCNADISGDGAVNGVDLAEVLANWGVCQANPTISGVYPAFGPALGGTAIAIVGVDLGNTASVTIDGVLAPQFDVVSATVVTAVTPPGTTGSRSVVLRDKQGQQIAGSTFTYAVTQLSWATVLEQVPDAAVVTNATLRNAIIATGYPWRVRDNGTGIEMTLIPPGTFNMGCSSSSLWGCNGDEYPVHPVTITLPFYMGRTEVKQATWSAVMGSNPSVFNFATAEVPLAEVPNRPVERVSWNTLQGFLSATGMRLPTEAEWEYAYRAGTTTAFHGWAAQPEGTDDDGLVVQIAWYGACCGGNLGSQTRPVGSKPANGFGLHDMAGNVYEWVSDWYSGNYYALSPSENPQGPSSGSVRVLRGGSWNDSSAGVRSSYRRTNGPDGADMYLGFRVARNP
jgi:formylglycine-generating enzyme required for sulfatase activity